MLFVSILFRIVEERGFLDFLSPTKLPTMSGLCNLKELIICKENHKAEYIRDEIMDIVRSKLGECDCNECKMEGREHKIIRRALLEHGNCLKDFINSHLHCRGSSVEQLKITKIHERMAEQLQIHVKDMKEYMKETYGSITEITDTVANDEHIETLKKYIDCLMIKAFDELSEMLLKRWDEPHVQSYLDHLAASKIPKEELLTETPQH